MGTLEVLHAHPSSVCAGARELIPGVSLGGFNASRRMVSSGEAAASDFHFFIAYARWTWEQLQAELDRNAWIIAACSPKLFVTPQLEDPCAEPAALWRNVLGLLQHDYTQDAR